MFDDMRLDLLYWYWLWIVTSVLLLSYACAYDYFNAAQHNRSAAQVPRVKELLPADYATNASSNGSSSSTPKMATSPTHPGLLSSLFGRKEDQQKRPVDDSKAQLSSAGASYHDQRFINVLNSCGDSLTETCKKQLLQAYQVNAAQSFYSLV